MDNIVAFILRFLVGDSVEKGEIVSSIGYTSDKNLFQNYKVIIIPSGFFSDAVYGTGFSIPELPLENIENVPLLFGKPTIEVKEGRIIVYADIIASTFFLISRYEEIIKRTERDQHGRFPGRSSLPWKAGFIHRPVVDEYGKLLRKWLCQAGFRIPEPEEKIKDIWLTHDVDIPFFCKTLRSAVRETFRGNGFLKAIKWYMGNLEQDPYFTFPWLLQKDMSLQKHLGKDKCHSVFFFKVAGKGGYDAPVYNPFSGNIQKAVSLCFQGGADVQLHLSYHAGKFPLQAGREKKRFESAFNTTVGANRNHYLCAREPEDFRILIKEGIYRDFTMGYADTGGFRLGTARSVNWIDPVKKEITSLLLTPLLIMDATLSGKNYLNLDFKEAYTYCMEIIRQVRKVHGELTLLWHNDRVADFSLKEQPFSWQRKLYDTILEELKEI